MAENINTNDAAYRQMLVELQRLRSVLAPRVAVLRRLDEERQRQWLQRDPLLRRSVLLARDLAKVLHVELGE